jgi:hypothetical protein
MLGSTLKSDSAILSTAAITCKYYVLLIKTDEPFSREIETRGCKLLCHLLFHPSTAHCRAMVPYVLIKQAFRDFKFRQGLFPQ